MWYKEFRTSLESIGFEFNPYDPCVANRMVNKLQHTVRFHVDNLKSSYKDPEVNTKFLLWLNKKLSVRLLSRVGSNTILARASLWGRPWREPSVLMINSVQLIRASSS